MITRHRHDAVIKATATPGSTTHRPATTVGLDALLLRPPAWTESAVCSQVDMDLHHPDQGCPTAAAIRVCRGCPVVGECLAFALEHRELHGVWGATTPAERKAMLRRSAEPLRVAS